MSKGKITFCNNCHNVPEVPSRPLGAKLHLHNFPAEAYGRGPWRADRGFSQAPFVIIPEYYIVHLFKNNESKTGRVRLPIHAPACCLIWKD